MSRLNKLSLALLAPLAALASLPLLPGCAAPGAETAGDSVAASAPAAKAAGVEMAAPASGAAPGQAQTAKLPAAMPRKIIYNANVELLTEDLSAAAKRLAEQVRASGGYVAETTVAGAPGSSRTGTWKVRVPVDRFDAFLAGLGGLGETQSTSVTSEDVSEEFYDLDARLKNKRVEEARLVEHLKKSTAKLTDILAVEQEVSRVREEIERMEGRQRYLANRADLTTVTITIREVKAFTPHQKPTLWTQMARTFGASLTALGDFARSMVLLVVALAPWLAVGAGVSYPLWKAARKRRKPTPTPKKGEPQ